MQFVDANIVLRYILWDHEELSKKANAIIEQENLELPFEVIAEVVYVLESVYETARKEIQEAILGLLKYPNIRTSDCDVLQHGLSLFVEKNLDFVDALLVAYYIVRKARIFSFDKKINKLVTDKKG